MANNNITSLLPKDKLIFCTKADHQRPSIYSMPKALENEKKPGIWLPDGGIDWTCPCLGGLPYGPCAYEFQNFFVCLKDNDKDNEIEQPTMPECIEKFKAMKSCFGQFPKLYPEDDGEKDTEE